MTDEINPIVQRLQDRRAEKNITQREISQLTGVPQAQISRIEAGLVDLRLSSLTTLANALDMEVVLVPRQAMPAVKSITRQRPLAAAEKLAQDANRLRIYGEILKDPEGFLDDNTSIKRLYSLGDHND